MPTKPLDRLMFAQGGLCFFCRKPLPKNEASVEHLLASANGGNNHDENCVACCKAINALLGSMSLKEKIQVVLNQRGEFKCPNEAERAKPPAQPNAVPASTLATQKKAVAQGATPVTTQRNSRIGSTSVACPTCKRKDGVAEKLGAYMCHNCGTSFRY